MPRCWSRGRSRSFGAVSGRRSRPALRNGNVWVPSFAAVAACVLLVSVAVLEVDRHGSRWLPSVVLDPADQPRDLFLTDPDFAAHRGQVISAEDIARWQKQRPNRWQQARVPLRPQPPQTWPQD